MGTSRPFLYLTKESKNAALSLTAHRDLSAGSVLTPERLWVTTPYAGPAPVDSPPVAGRQAVMQAAIPIKTAPRQPMSATYT